MSVRSAPAGHELATSARRSGLAVVPTGDFTDDESPVFGGSPLLPLAASVPPLPPIHVERPRLLATLDAAVADAALTLIHGPAGTGKTTLAAAWAASDRPPGPLAWLPLRPEDDSRSRFWRRVVQAVAEAHGDGPLGRVTFPSTAAIDELLERFVSALHDADHAVVLVLDDLPRLRDAALCHDLNALLQSPPPRLRIVATVRAAPGLRLARLRLSGALAEVDAGELALTLAETEAVLARGCPDLGAAARRLLWERTEGWAAGVGLVSTALGNRPDADALVANFAGDVTPIADYLLEEVFQRQPEHVRAFLLDTCICESLCGELANAITGEDDGGQILDDLHQRGLPIAALDEHRHWFRLHRLLRDALLGTLRRERGPADIATAHERASRWLAAHDRPVLAARHAVAARSPDLVGDLCARHAFSLTASGRLGELAEVLQGLPHGERARRPILALVLGAAALESGDARVAARWIDQADNHAEDLESRHRPAFAAGRAVCGLYHARLTAGPAPDLAPARAVVGPRPPGAADDPDARALVRAHLGTTELWAGALTPACEHLEAAARTADPGREFLRLYAVSHLAVAHTARGDVEAGRQAAEHAARLADDHGWRATPRAGPALSVLGHHALLAGDPASAQRLHAEALAAASSHAERPLRAFVLLGAARTERAVGNLERASDLAARAANAIDGADHPQLADGVHAEQALALHAGGRTDDAIAILRAQDGGPRVAAAHARLCLDAGDPTAALELARPATDGVGDPEPRLDALLITSAAHRVRDEVPEAADALDRALALAEPYGWTQPFGTVGDWLPARLAAFRPGDAHHDFARAVTRTDGVAREPIAAFSPREPLSERELSILRLLPTALSNREIAGEVFLSLNTVKTHLKRIYAKLDVHDRAQAVERARGCGLL
jgi:LuxR family maltose regulon positive regulatory protein